MSVKVYWMLNNVSLVVFKRYFLPFSNSANLKERVKRLNKALETDNDRETTEGNKNGRWREYRSVRMLQNYQCCGIRFRNPPPGENFAKSDPYPSTS